MASLQVLRKRYKSIQATADMASAMKTSSSIKYARISRELNNIDAYSRACDDTLALFGNAVLSRNTQNIKSRNCLVLFSNNRGFCGGFNSEILKFFSQQMENQYEEPLLLVNGQKGINYCKSMGLKFEILTLNEIPSYQNAEDLTAKLFEIYASGEADHIELIYQRFENMMTQIPTRETILPHQTSSETDQDSEILFLPDRQTAMYMPSMYCLTNSIYRIILGHYAGIHAATTIAMRSACDNAEKSLANLETMINRIRQAEVTNSVIETSSFLAGHFK